MVLYYRAGVTTSQMTSSLKQSYTGLLHHLLQLVNLCFNFVETKIMFWIEWFELSWKIRRLTNDSILRLFKNISLAYKKTNNIMY